MPALQIKIASSFFQAMVQDFLSNKPIYLGLITSGNETTEAVATSQPEFLRTAEYNAGGWIRPVMTIKSQGTYNSTLNRWDLPENLEWSFVGPVGGLQLKQVVIILGGIQTPRDLTGITVGHTTYVTPLVIAAGATQIIEAPWTIS